MATELGVAYISILPETSKIAPGVKKALGDNSVAGQADKSGKSMGSRLTDGMGKAMKRGAQVAGAGLLGVLGTALYKGFGRLKGIEEAEAKLRGLGHSTKTVETVMKNALGAVKGTAFGLQDAATVAAGTVAAGIKPGKDLEKTLTLVGDAATIAGTDLGTMGSIFNKVAASNKIQGDVIAQLNDAGIPIIQLLGKELGTTAEETVALASKGKINFATFQKAMESGLGGAAQKSGQTVSGAFANMQAALGRLGASLLGGIFSKLPNLFGNVTAKLDTLGPIAERAGRAIGSTFAGMVKAMKPVARIVSDVAGTMARKFEPVVKRVGRFMQDNPKVVKAFAIALGVLAAAIAVVTIATTAFSIALNSTGIPLVIIGIAALVAGLVYAYQKSDKFREVVDKLGQAMRRFGEWMWKTVIPATVELAKKVGDNLQPIWVALAEFFQKSVVPVMGKLIDKFIELWPTIQKVVTIAFKMWAEFVKFYTWLAGKIIPVVIKVAGFLLRNFVPAIVAVYGSVVKVIGKIVEFGAKLVDGQRKVQTFASKVGTAISGVVLWFIRLPGLVVSAVGQVATLLYQKGKDLIQGFWNGIKDKWDDVKDKAKDIGKSIASTLSSPFRFGSPSKLFRQYGIWTIEGFEQGVATATPGALSRMSSTGSALASAFSTQPVLSTDAASSALGRATSADPFAALQGVALNVTVGASRETKAQWVREGTDTLSARR